MAELLLDTTYLLPAFGISVGLKGFQLRFTELLDSYSVLYNPVSLVESKWAVLKKAREDRPNRGALLGAFRTGLKVIESDGRLRETPLTSESVEEVGDQLLADGLKDYFDRLIYGTAADRRCALLTEDRELLRLRRREGPGPSAIMSWKDVL